ncbi:MAG: helix-turn-helix transcriptional regulator [Candidatus Dormiibacterota bacterium]
MRKYGSTSFREHVADIEANLAPADRQVLDAMREHYSLSRQVLELRRGKGLSQEDLATRAGLDQSEISKLERGSSNPTRNTLEKVAGALGAHLGLIPDSEGSLIAGRG